MEDGLKPDARSFMKTAASVAKGSVSELLTRSPKTEVWINRVAGVVFVGLAANIVLSK